MSRTVHPDFPRRMRELLDQRGWSYRTLAARTYYGKSYLYELATGRKQPTVEVAQRIDQALAAGGELAAMVTAAPPGFDALELANRVAASDLSAETLARLELAVDDLAVAYARLPAQVLIPRVGEHLAYVTRLLDGRKTLAQHRRLLVAGGWLTLLNATCQIDMQTRTAATASLRLSRQLAEQAEHPEIAAWVLETRAWDALTNRQYRAAVKLSQQAQMIAPRGSSALIQATAQEGRAWARMGQPVETRDALDRTDRLVSSLPVPDRPEHHYRYDPAKATAYIATTLAWVGDPMAEEYARDVVAHLDKPTVGQPRPRRVALAQIDLALALVAADKPDEAVAVAIEAVSSGRFVRSNWWRATEVLTRVVRSGIPETAQLRAAYDEFRP